MKECEPVISLNEKFFQPGKKYIAIDEDEENADNWGMDTMLLLSEKGIFIDGFVSARKEYIGAVWCRKKVFAVSDIEKDSFVCTRQNIYEITSNLRNKIVIFGAGLNGKRIVEILKRQGRDAECFVDSNLSEMENKEQTGKRIYSTEYIKNLDSHYSVILAGVAWEEMLVVVMALNLEVNVFWFEWDRLCGRCLCNRLEFEHFDYMVRGKTIYVYGCSDCVKKFINLAEYMGYHIEMVLMDDSGSGDMCGVPAAYIEDILYQSDFFIAVDNKDRSRDYEKLTNLGLRYAVDYTFIQSIDSTLQYDRATALDVNLGYTFVGKSRYPGFTIYGENREDDFKIVALGGSTTDGALYPFRSWPEILYEKWPTENVTVFNGGVAGYASGQELLKLIRDVLELKPDIIIEYGTVNDIWINEEEPYAFQYVKKVFTYANKHLDPGKDTFFRVFTERFPCTGIRWKKEKPEIWLKNITMMHHLSKMNGIEFYAFIQPDLYTKENKNACERGIWINNIGHEKTNRLNFVRYIKENDVVQKYNYVYDLTEAFDRYFDVYQDLVHLNEKGNAVIADLILEVVGKCGKRGMEE